MSEVLAALTAAAGGFVGGLLGVGGGVLFVPALTVFLGLSQIEGEATSLLIIVPVAIAGMVRQRGYGNVDLRLGLLVGALSPLGVLAGTAIANEISERALELLFAGLALSVAFGLLRRALTRPT